MTTDEEWIEFRKFVELVKSHKVNFIETKIGKCKVTIRNRGNTTHIDLQEAP